METFKEKILNQISRLPFVVRIIMFIITTGSIVLYHHMVFHWLPWDCPKEMCPALSISDNTNKWRFPERPYAAHQQAIALEAFIWSWRILIPDWRQLLRRAAKFIYNKLENFYNQYIMVTPPTPTVTYQSYKTADMHIQIWE